MKRRGHLSISAKWKAVCAAAVSARNADEDWLLARALEIGTIFLTTRKIKGPAFAVVALKQGFT